MKISHKIFTYSTLVFIVIFTIAGVILTEYNYNVMINEEINNTLSQEKNFEMLIRNIVFRNAVQKWREGYNKYFNINEYITVEEVIKQSLDKSLSNYFDKNINITIEDKDRNIITSTDNKVWGISRPEIKSANQGNRSYILRYVDGKHYIFIANSVNLNMNDYLIISYVKDITYTENIKKNNYKVFFLIEIISTLILLFLMYFVSKYITKPIGNLINATENISQGNYEKRIDSHTNDEIGLLSVRFNEMVSKIEESINKLENQSEEKQRFIDNLTHELKTPLTSIIGYADILRTNDYKKDLFNKGLYNIYSEAKRMKSIIDSLMYIIVHKNKAVQIQNENIKQLFAEVKDVMKINLESCENNLEIRTNDISIPIDKGLMKMCITNLVYNAIKASKSGDVIILGLKEDKERKTIYVKDEGKGIPEEELANIIEPFYRVDKSRSRELGGVGLGLYICNEIVKLHNGELRINSELNKGTIIEIFI